MIGDKFMLNKQNLNNNLMGMCQIYFYRIICQIDFVMKVDWEKAQYLQKCWVWQFELDKNDLVREVCHE